MTRQAAVRYGHPRVCDYWCQLVARVPESEAEWFLGGALVPTPRLAVRWLRGQTERVSGALHPDPRANPYPRACLRPVPAEDGAELCPFDPTHWENLCRTERILAALLVGEPVVVVHTVADRFAGRGDVRVRYEFSARPVPARTSAYAGAVGTLSLVQPSVNREKLMSVSDLAPLSWRRRLVTTVSRWSTVLLMLLLVFGSSGPAVAAVGSPATNTPADLPDASERLTTPQVEAMTEIADSADQLRRMKVIVKRADKDRMEPMLMGVVRLPGERPVLVDPEGDVYREGMADFRRDNDLFSRDDDLLYNENWEDETAEVDLVTVSASTAPDPVWWWYAGGGAVAVLALGVLAWRLRAHRRLAAHYESLRESDADPRPPEAAAGQRATDG